VKIINKYILKEHIGPFVFALTALTSLMILQYVARKFGDLVGKGLSWQVIADFFVLSIPFTVAMTFPMAVLVAVLYAFSRFGAENEITALKASGVSTRAMLTPVLLASTVLALGMIWFNDQVLPRSNHKLATLQVDIFKTKPTFALREGVINTIKEQLFYLRAGRIDEESGTMHDVAIDDLGDPSRRRTLLADSGTLYLAPNKHDLNMTLYDGMMLSIPTDNPGQLSRLYYKVNRMKVPDVFKEFEQTNADDASKSDREMGVCEMQDALIRAHNNVQSRELAWADAAWTARRKSGIVEPHPPMRQLDSARGLGHYYCVATGKLDAWITRLRSASAVKTAAAATLNVADQAGPPGAGNATSAPTPPPSPQAANPEATEAAAHAEVMRGDYVMARKQENRWLIEIHKKFSLATACIVLALVGGPLAIRFPRGGVGLVIGVSFVIFAIYYVCLIAGESLANRVILQPWVAMWGANAIFLVIGLTLYLRMGAETATNRGGDAGELFASLRAGLARRLGIGRDRQGP
jgi:lipopolysaccharide export system permease protein